MCLKDTKKYIFRSDIHYSLVFYWRAPKVYIIKSISM